MHIFSHAAGITYFTPLHQIYPFSCSYQIGAEWLWFCPFADEIRLQRVPVGGIAVKSSCPGAEQPFLQGSASLSDSSRRGEMMAMPTRAFDFSSISPCLRTVLLIADRPHFAPLLKERFENVVFVMWSPWWGWQRGGQTLILLFFPQEYSFVDGDFNGFPVWTLVQRTYVLIRQQYTKEQNNPSWSVINEGQSPEIVELKRSPNVKNTN